MKSLGVALLLLDFVYTAQAADCSYTCTQTEKYYTSCGFWGWSSCTRYRTGYTTCYKPCPINGGWSAWQRQSATTCPVTCGGGTQSVTYTRTCTNPAPQYDGASCSGSTTSVQSESCNTNYCPIPGGWTAYQNSVGSCSVTCGGGIQTVTSTRTCTNPAPQYGGTDCVGSATRITSQSCNTDPCPIDGGWTDWQVQSTGECSVTCGGGTQSVTSTRTCANPAPHYGGRECDGDATQITNQSCNTNPCPVDGGWSDWDDWQEYDECSVLCGGGRKDQWRTRRCDNPAPAYGGSGCIGADTENQTAQCNTENCGDRCPEGANTFIANANKAGRYYQCDNGVARRMECAAGTMWDQDSTTCINDGSQQVPLHPGGKCDPNIVYNKHQDCTKFIMCIYGSAIEMSCPAGTRYNPAISTCDFADNVPCN